MPRQQASFSDLYAILKIKVKPGGDFTTLSMALLDSGNLLKLSVISAKLHKQLGLKLYPTSIRAKTASNAKMPILGSSEPFYIQFVSTTPTFKISPLVVKDMTTHINLGSRFFFENDIIPQMVREDRFGCRANHAQVKTEPVRLFNLRVGKDKLARHLADKDPEFSKLLRTGDAELLGSLEPPASLQVISKQPPANLQSASSQPPGLESSQDW